MTFATPILQNPVLEWWKWTKQYSTVYFRLVVQMANGKYQCMTSPMQSFGEMQQAGIRKGAVKKQFVAVGPRLLCRVLFQTRNGTLIIILWPGVSNTYLWRHNCFLLIICNLPNRNSKQKVKRVLLCIEEGLHILLSVVIDWFSFCVQYIFIQISSPTTSCEAIMLHSLIAVQWNLAKITACEPVHYI